MFDQNDQLRAGLLRPDAFCSESVMLLDQITGNLLQVMFAVYGNRRETVNLIVTDIKLAANVRNPFRIHILKYIHDDFGVFSGVHDYLKGKPSSSVSGKSIKPLSLAVVTMFVVEVRRSPLYGLNFGTSCSLALCTSQK